MLVLVNTRLTTMGEKLKARVQFDIPLYNSRFDVISAIFEKNQQREFILCTNIYKPINYV